MRSKLLTGRLELPSYEKFLTAVGKHYTELASKMVQAMWYAYLKDKGSINLPYWADRFDNAKVFNIVLLSLSEAGWIESHAIPQRNWAEASLNQNKLLEYCTQDELESIRAHNKFRQYRLTAEESTLTKATRLNGKTVDTGLVREGFMQAGNSTFTYDQATLSEYRTVVQRNLTKSMDKIAEMCPNLRHDRASYDTISCDILDFHLSTDEVFTRGNNYNDSRGRAISSCLSKVANPISCKDFRALIVIPEA